jgi:DNA repair protein RadC
MLASRDRLISTLAGDERTAERIAAAQRLGDAALRETLVGETVAQSSAALRGYLRRRLGPLREESLLLVYLDANGVFLAEDFFPGQHRSGISIPARVAIRRAFDLDARRIILAHNHPSGLARPSPEDIAATRSFARMLRALEILLDDHLIVSDRTVESMREGGHLPA